LVKRENRGITTVTELKPWRLPDTNLSKYVPERCEDGTCAFRQTVTIEDAKEAERNVTTLVVHFTDKDKAISCGNLFKGLDETFCPCVRLYYRPDMTFEEFVADFKVKRDDDKHKWVAPVGIECGKVALRDLSNADDLIVMSAVEKRWSIGLVRNTAFAAIHSWMVDKLECLTDVMYDPKGVSTHCAKWGRNHYTREAAKEYVDKVNARGGLVMRENTTRNRETTIKENDDGTA